MYYEKTNSVNMIEDGTHEGVITRVSEYNNPNGANKLIVEISMEDGTLFSHFFTPGFPSFDDLIKLTGVKPQSKGEFDEQSLVNKMVNFETKIVTAKNGNQYCNVVAISELTPFKEDKADTPAGSKKK